MRAFNLIGSAVAVFVLSAPPTAGEGDHRAGQDIFFSRCIQCHAVGCNRGGPKLQGVIGRAAGSVMDFEKYTDALKQSGLVWTHENLDRFLRDPVAMVPGTSMWVGKVENDQQRKEVIAFLQQNDTSLDLCPR